VDARSDIYSLCVILFELLTLKHPLGELTNVVDVALALSLPAPRPRQLMRAMVSAEAPCEYAYLVARGLANDPHDRQPSLSAVETELDDLAMGKIPIVCPLTAAKRAGYGALRWLDRHGRAFTYVILLAMIAFAVFAVRMGMAFWTAR
jgi:serine/threonine-protein kinase